jgi:serine/threonine protein kinase
VQSLERGAIFAGRYVVTQLLGEGASGGVFAAHDPEMDAAVAIKVLRPELAEDGGLRARFRREAGLLQHLSHPAIVTVLGGGETPLHPGGPALPFVVMERLTGLTLRASLAGPCSRADVLTWLLPVASALTQVHAMGVLHGDIKPDNLFLTDGGPKLVDFGSAKVHGFPRLTATGELTGTPHYMAPEVISGERTLDARADVYALGVTVFEALAGRLPFTARHPGRLVAEIMRGDLPSLLTRRPDLAALAPVVAQAMHRTADGRFPSAEAFALALAAVAVS